MNHADRKQLDTNFYGRAQEAASKIVDAFASGQLPKALAPIFVRRKDNVPCRSWSWGNQLLVALFGYSDARGVRQWNAVSRNVKKGEHGFPILVPLLCTKTRIDDDSGDEEEIRYAYGFKHATVFGIDQTEGDPLPRDTEIESFLDSLPLIQVARSWELTVEAFDGERASCFGKYALGRGIALGVKNLSTWAHELVHAADDRRHGPLKPRQQWDQEIVAELGGATLLEILGYVDDEDRGGCWEYVQRYAESTDLPPIAACQTLLKRICESLAFLLDTAEQPSVASTHQASAFKEAC